MAVHDGSSRVFSWAANHNKRRPLPRRGQVKAAIAAALVRSVASVALDMTSTVKKSLSRRFSSSRRFYASSFSASSSCGSHSQASLSLPGISWDSEDDLRQGNVGRLKFSM
eukprot:Gb_14118 [translate_table: standard]